MAGRGLASAHGETCQLLLQKLQDGQEDLHRSLQRLQPSKKKRARGVNLRVTNVRYKDGGASPLCCVRHLPLRRARTDQLSPNSPPCHGHRKKIRKRLSSTPKNPTLAQPPPPLTHSHVTPHETHHTAGTSHPHSPPLTPSHITPHSPRITDFSLEDALLLQPHTRTCTRTSRKTEGEREECTKRSQPSEQSQDSLRRKSKRRRSKRLQARQSVGESCIEKEAGDGDGSGVRVSECSAPQTSMSTTATRVSESIRSRYETGGSKKKKPRGLTVSFVTDETASQREGGGCDGGGRGDLSYGELKGKREQRLMSSLNSSSYGALEHNRRKSGRSHTKSCKPGGGGGGGGGGEGGGGGGEGRRGGGGGGGKLWSGDERMLGYDWIAGLVDAGSQLEEKEDEYFVEMREFRKVNHSECSRPHPIFLPASDESPASSPSPTHPPLSATHTHCTQSYVLNNRLFPVSQSASGEGGACGDGECGKKCPACEGRTGNGRKSENKVVHYIRVSVPRRSVQAPYQLRPHRRRSFDPSDSMALNKHCLAGWNSTKPPGLSPQPTLDLKSAITRSPHSHPHTHPSPSHTSPTSHLTGCRRKTRPSGRSVTHGLLNTSHRAEYTIQSRRHRNM